jgi:hypothetical protein
MSNPYRDRLLGVGFINGPLPSKPRVREGRRPDGVRIKATTDELGNTVTEHAKGDRQDVRINAATVTATSAMKGTE